MKDSIQQDGSEVAIVIYDAPLPPRYFRFTKKFIRIFLVVVPVLLVSLLLGLFLWGLGARVQDQPRPSMPDVISSEDSRLTTLENEIKSLKASNTELSDKLSTAPGIPSAAEDPYLMTIKKPYGMQNFLSENRVTLDQFELIQEANSTALKFQIISSNPDTKVTGHVLVFMISDAGVMAYPVEANQNVGQGVKFSSGEPFSVSRLRPTNANYLHRLSGETVKFVVYIFSREGDLLLIRETESFKVGSKS